MTTPAQDPPTNSSQHDLDQSWDEFLETRDWVREVVSDDDLRAFGFNLEVLDRKPEAGDFPQAADVPKTGDVPQAGDFA